MDGPHRPKPGQAPPLLPRGRRPHLKRTMALLEKGTSTRKGPAEQTLAHLYRAEVSRSTTWRTRLDTTTNWAITTAAAVLSIAFTTPTSPHATVLVGLVLVGVFLVIESRRYRYYDMWARRVRMLESAYLVPLLRREEATDDFNAALASELARPRLHISMLDSLCFRMMRTYWPLVGLMLLGWVVKLDVHPTSATRIGQLVERAQIGPVPGLVVWAAWAIAAGLSTWLFLRGRRTPLPPTELRAARRQRRELGAAVQRLVEQSARSRVR